MRYSASEKLEIIELVEQSTLSVGRTLASIGIPRSTFYDWYGRYQDGGIEALEDGKPRPQRVWNKIPDAIGAAIAHWYAFEVGEVRVIGDKPWNIRKDQDLQSKLHRKAKQEPAFRFYLLYDKVCREDILRYAYVSPRECGCARQIEALGVEVWLAGLREDLVPKTYRPDSVRRVTIPKPGGGERPLGVGADLRGGL